MKLITIGLLIFLLANCSKPKTVLICGDHVCINKNEAKQYFEENLSIEIKVIDNKVKEEIDLVELNLRENIQGKNQISISSKSNTNETLKTLSSNEISKIKENIKIKEKEKKIAKKIFKKDSRLENQIKKEKNINKDNRKSKINKILTNKVNKKRKYVVDVCTILEKCSIDEISKYLLEQGKKKNFPNITQRQ